MLPPDIKGLTNITVYKNILQKFYIWGSRNRSLTILTKDSLNVTSWYINYKDKGELISFLLLEQSQLYQLYIVEIALFQLHSNPLRLNTLRHS